MLCLFFLSTFLSFGLSAYSDIPLDEAQKTYEVPFAHWVFVYLNVSFGASSEHYSIQIYRKIVDNQLRFVVEGRAANTPVGKEWYQKYGSKIQEQLQLLCNFWTKQGYPLSLDDFEINIKEPIQ